MPKAKRNIGQEILEGIRGNKPSESQEGGK